MNYSLKHHGITKQKWGVRNGPPYPLKESQKSAAERKAAHALSDDELRTQINRMQLEKQYRQLLQEKVDGGNEKKRKKGNGFLSESGKEIAKKTITTVGSSLAILAVTTAINKASTKGPILNTDGKALKMDK